MSSAVTPTKVFAWTAYFLAVSFVFCVGLSHFVKAPYRSWLVNLLILCSIVPLVWFLRHRIKAKWQRPLEIRCGETGLVLTNRGSSQTDVSLEWKEVETVIAYKRDVFAHDLICLALVTRRGTIQVHEEMQGWSKLIDQLPSVLPGTLAPLGWWERVAFPAFAPNPTTLFKRE